MLVLAFLVSPFGLPAIGEWLLERLYGVKSVSYTHLYNLLTTRPEDLKNEAKTE